MSDYHIPVLLKESIDALNIRDHGIYVDTTLGGGGHTRAILERNETITLVSFDRDEDAIKQTASLQKEFSERLIIVRDNFANLRTGLALNRIKHIDGILFDLGVSSHQINSFERGFSFIYDTDLDMRMDQSAALTAFDVINKFPFEKLISIFYEYGEEKESGRIANAIVKNREIKEICTTTELAEIIDRTVFSKQKIKAKARIFQAIRIFLNNELESLKIALADSVKILHPGGRIAVISYHSLEDRIVKKFFKNEAIDCVCPPDLLKCGCNKTPTLKIISKKPILPTSAEILQNNRARSAKLRIAEKKEIL